MTDLNATENFDALDPQGMLNHALNLPNTCADAWELAEQTFSRLDLEPLKQVRRIVLVGMGGSAIGGDLLSALVADESSRPVYVQRGYDLPAFVKGSETLVIGSSYSGNTEETLSAFTQARQRGALLFAATTNGEIARLAEEWEAPVFRFEYESQPRAALGYSFVPLVNLLGHLGFISDKSKELAEAVDTMRAWQAEIAPSVQLSDNAAKQLAQDLMERIPVVYGAGITVPVARRWKTQLDENAKRWAFYEEMPELNHNSVVGYETSELVQDRVTILTLRSAHDSERMQARWRITSQILEREGVENRSVEARGSSQLAQMLSLIHFGDLVSVYLALASDIDPTPVSTIGYLKEQLAAIG
jgi:glucose/mannose-6-phosphate isomerase